MDLSIKSKLTTLAVLTVCACLVLYASGTTEASTTTGDGAGRLACLSGDSINCNVSAPAYLGLDASAWNFTANGTYAGSSATVSIWAWLNDGTSNTSFAIVENYTRAAATPHFDNYTAQTPSNWVYNTSATLFIATWLDHNGDFNVSNASDTWAGTVQIQNSSLLASLEYFLPTIISLAIFGGIIGLVTRAFPK